MTRHQPVSCLSLLLPFLAAVVVGIAAWQCVRPAVVPDVPTATATSSVGVLVTVTDPIPRLPSPPPHTPMPPEPVLLTPTRTPAPPTGTPSPTVQPTDTPTPESTRAPVQKG
jgi:hypothetical protein